MEKRSYNNEKKKIKNNSLNITKYYGTAAYDHIHITVGKKLNYWFFGFFSA